MCIYFLYYRNSSNVKIILFTDLADRPMILIRFNPDYSKQTKKSCFDKECRLIKTEWNKRIKVLKKEINKALKEIPTELITTIYLF